MNVISSSRSVLGFVCLMVMSGTSFAQSDSELSPFYCGAIGTNCQTYMRFNTPVPRGEASFSGAFYLQPGGRYEVNFDIWQGDYPLNVQPGGTYFGSVVMRGSWKKVGLDYHFEDLGVFRMEKTGNGFLLRGDLRIPSGKWPGPASSSALIGCHGDETLVECKPKRTFPANRRR